MSSHMQVFDLPHHTLAGVGGRVFAIVHDKGNGRFTWATFADLQGFHRSIDRGTFAHAGMQPAATLDDVVAFLDRCA